MFERTYIVKLKLKSIFKPIEFEIENFEFIEKLFSDLKNQFNFITIANNFAFNKNELKYIIVKVKKER